MFAFTPRIIHLSEIHPFCETKPNQIQICQSGTKEYYGEIIEEDDKIIINTVFDWKNYKTYSVEYTEDQ